MRFKLKIGDSNTRHNCCYISLTTFYNIELRRKHVSCVRVVVTKSAGYPQASYKNMFSLFLQSALTIYRSHAAKRDFGSGEVTTSGKTSISPFGIISLIYFQPAQVGRQ